MLNIRKRPKFLRTFLDLTSGVKDRAVSIRMRARVKREIESDSQSLNMSQSEYIERLVLCRMHSKLIGNKKVFLAKESLEELFES